MHPVQYNTTNLTSTIILFSHYQPINNMNMIKFSMSIGSIALGIVAFFVQKGYGNEEPVAAGVTRQMRIIQDDEHQHHHHVKQDVSVASSLSIMMVGDELTDLSLSGSLSYVENVETKKTDSRTFSKVSKSPTGAKSKKSSCDGDGVPLGGDCTIDLPCSCGTCLLI